MSRDAVITVRVPSELKQRLATRAKRERRSISAQVVVELERALVRESEAGRQVSALGLFKGATMPEDSDFDEVRSLLWRRLEPSNG